MKPLLSRINETIIGQDYWNYYWPGLMKPLLSRINENIIGQD